MFENKNRKALLNFCASGGLYPLFTLSKHNFYPSRCSCRLGEKKNFFEWVRIWLMDQWWDRQLDLELCFEARGRSETARKRMQNLESESEVKGKVSCAWLFATPWTVAHQVPLSMGFLRQEYWSEWPFPPPGVLGNPVTELDSLASPTLAGRSLPLSHLENP